VNIVALLRFDWPLVEYITLAVHDSLPIVIETFIALSVRTFSDLSALIFDSQDNPPAFLDRSGCLLTCLTF
jgi:hypothetical protein